MLQCVTSYIGRDCNKKEEKKIHLYLISYLPDSLPARVCVC